MKKIVGYTFIVLVVLCIIVYFIAKNFGARPLPDYNKPVALKGIHANVEVYRDSYAIPHVFANNEEDLYRTVGYLTAQDRLWQMDLLRRVTQGRLSEIFGKDLIKTDMLMRSLQITEKSMRIIAQTDPQIIKAFNAYAEGINSFINDNYKKLPIEFKLLGYKPEPWRIEHSVNLIGYIAWDLNGAWNAEIILHKLAGKLNAQQLADILPGYDSTQRSIYPAATETDWRGELMSASSALQDLGLQVFRGSNNWVIAGSKTASGKPILANDMHLSFSAPGIWYQIHQVIPGKLNVTGVLLPGQPFVVSGHNQNIAWGLTNVMNDDIDFYRETVNPLDSNKYRLDGKWLNMRIKTEKIAVKGSDTVNFTMKFTHRGPVISALKGISTEVISMRWMGNEPGNEVQSIYKLNRAANWAEFCQAMKTFISISQNVAYADVNGNIGMYCCAGVPIRKGNPLWVQPGDTSAYDWLGLIPFEELPHKFNPIEGFAVSANNRTVDSSYNHYISAWFDLSFRYDCIYEALNSEKKFTIADNEAIQTDYSSKQVLYYLPGLLESLKNQPALSENSKKALSLLQDWDGVMGAKNVCASVFEVFYNMFIENLVMDEMGPQLFSEFLNDKILVKNTIHNVWRNRASVLCDNKTTPGRNETFDDIVVKSFNETTFFLTDKFGNNLHEWEWGKIHLLTLPHALGKVNILNKIFCLNRGPFAAPGSFHTVAYFSYKFAKPFNATSGASQRHIYDFSNWDNSVSVIPSGTSGIPSSPHYCDQTEMYLQGKYHADLFSPEAIKLNYKYKTVFSPLRVSNR